MYVCVEDGGWGEVRLKLDVQGQASGRILDADGQGIGGLENGTIFMDVICVSSHIGKMTTFQTLKKKSTNWQI